MVGVTVVMIYTNWQFTVLSLVIVPALFVVVLGYTTRIKEVITASITAPCPQAGCGKPYAGLFNYYTELCIFLTLPKSIA